MKKLLAGMVVAVALAGCGGADNVGACKKFVEAAKCGTAAFTFDCDVYKNTTCDISSYFNCAAEHYVCKDGMYDAAKLGTFSTDCASKATCK